MPEAGSAADGHSGEPNGHRGRKNVVRVNVNGRGEFALEFEGVAPDGHANHPLRAVFIRIAESDVLVERLIEGGARARFDEEILLGGWRR